MSKKPTPRKEEPPTEQEAPIGIAAEDIPNGGAGLAITLERGRPLAAPEPAIEDRTAALELASIELEQRIRRLERNCKASHGMR